MIQHPDFLESGLQASSQTGGTESVSGASTGSGGQTGGPSVASAGADTGDTGDTADVGDGTGTSGPDDGGEAQCGNGVVEFGEECDGNDLAGLNCAGIGAGEGELGCTEACEFALFACSSCRNVLVNPSVETGDLSGWEVLQNEGEGYLVSSILSHDGTWNVATSSGEFTRGQEVDLIAAGFDPARLDDGPSVRAELWVRETHASDRWWMHVELRDENHDVIGSWSDSAWTNGNYSYGDDTWLEVSHSFATVPAGLRYVYFEDGGVDGDGWAGNYGVKLDSAAFIVCE